MRTDNVTIDVGGLAMPAYVARPGSGTAPGVIIVHEIFGVDAGIRKLTDLCASAGYVAVAPAMFHRVDPHFEAGHDDAGFDTGRAAAATATHQSLRDDITAAAAWLRAQPDCDGRVAVWGFCFGGSVAFLSATFPEIDAAVAFYGGQIAAGPRFIDQAEHLRAPVFVTFGGKDPYIPVELAHEVRTRLEELGKAHEFVLYDEGDHGFFRHGPEDNDAARDVWPRVQAFLQRHLPQAVAR